MTGRLKVYDADLAEWRYVDSAGAEVELLRYVPLDPQVALNTAVGLGSSTAANIGTSHTPVLSFLPTTAVAVSVLIFASHTVISAGHRFNVYAYNAALSAAALRAQMMSGKVANHNETVTAHYVELGGDRQFDYAVTIGTAGTTTYGIYVTGYWVKEPSSAIAVGPGPEDILVQAGTVSITFAAVGSTSSPVTFPVPYPSVPVVVVTAKDASIFVPGAMAVTTTGFNANLRHYDNTAQSVTVTANWIAVGPRP